MSIIAKFIRIHIFVVLILFLASCQTHLSPMVLSQPKSQSLSDTDSFGYTQADRQSLAHRIRNKPKSNSFITIGIQPGLLSGTERVATTGVFSADNFHTQNTPTSFWELHRSFEVGNHDFPGTLPDSIDTAHRYQLVLQSISPMKISIFTENKLIYQANLEGGNPVKVDRMIFTPHQTLDFKVESLTSNNLDVYMYQEEDAGSIFRSLQRPLRPVQTQDYLFDPNRVNGLSHLQPHEGERIINEFFKITGILVNATDRLDFQSGVLILETEKPEVLSEFIQRYNAQTLEQIGNRYLMKLDLSKSPIARLPELFHTYNQAIETDIEQASFASLSGLQTFAILLDALVNHPELEFASIEMNVYPELHQTPTPSATPIPSPTPHTVCPGNPPKSGKDWLYNDMNIGYSWWLTDTRVVPYEGSTPPKDAAWNYSLGSNIKVAYLDQGFNQNHSEIKRRTIVGQGYNNTDRLGQPGGSAADHESVCSRGNFS